MSHTTRLDVSIPSSSDKLSLEGTIYLPWEIPAGSLNRNPSFTSDGYPKLALLAHPWGRFGGTKDDPVLTRYITPSLLEAGYVVVTYNARGVGRSGGWSSWMGGSEGEDAAAVISWALQRMGLVKGEKASLICCGYSYGSLAAVLSLPLVCSRYPALAISCLLVSPPISLISTMAYLPFAARRFDAAVKSQEPVLAIMGDRDQFTAVERCRTWVTENSVEYGEITGADHFWREGSGPEMVDAIRGWLIRLA